MTAPIDSPTKLDQLRAELRGALVKTMEAVGWPAERVHLFPPRQTVTPTAWVDVPTLAQTNMGGAPGIAATFPVCIAVDGLAADQVAKLDQVMARGVDNLLGVGDLTLLTAGPDWIDLTGMGAPTRALVFQVQRVVLLRTLCTGTITPSNDPAEGSPTHGE